MFVVTGTDARWFAKAGASATESWFYREVAPGLSWVPGSTRVSDPAVTLIDYLDGVPSLLDVARAQPQAALSVLVALAPLLAHLHAWSAATPGGPVPAAAPALPDLNPVHVSAWLDGTQSSCHLLHSIHSREVLSRTLRAGVAGMGPVGLIHGDLKVDNILCRAGEPVVIDWELSGHGHVAWDLGSVLGSILAIWIDGVDFDGSTPAMWLEETLVPYAAIREAACQLLADYRKHAEHQVPSMSAVVSYAATWLVVRSWAESLFSLYVNPRHLLRLVVAEGLVRNPTALFAGEAW